MQFMEDGPTRTPTVVGVLAPTIYWRHLLTDILPEGSGGLVAVFSFGRIYLYVLHRGPTCYVLGTRRSTRRILQPSENLSNVPRNGHNYLFWPSTQS